MGGTPVLARSGWDTLPQPGQDGVPPPSRHGTKQQSEHLLRGGTVCLLRSRRRTVPVYSVFCCCLVGGSLELSVVDGRFYGPCFGRWM